jgi:hypothetical protein
MCVRNPIEAFLTDSISTALRAVGSNAMLVALHLIKAPALNHIGFYHLPISAIASATALTIPEVHVAISELEQIGYSRYHHATEMVWIIDWSRLTLGQLKSRDKKMIELVNAEYAAIPKDCPLRNDFLWRHALLLRLSIIGATSPDEFGSENDLVTQVMPASVPSEAACRYDI